VLVVTGLLLILCVRYAAEYRRHQANIRRIPIRVHVNGIRGKSSVTRLIAAGLRAGGIRTIAKTTGTTPRFIYPDGTEAPVIRPGKANIIEQVRIVRRAAELQARALVVECMAIQPELQSLLEDRMIYSTHSVITNARSDHLDVMGPTVADVAHNLARTIGRGGQLFTSERVYLREFEEVAARRGALVHCALPESVSNEDLERFPYFEHADNVAVALAVCSSLGVDRWVALPAMVAATPDPGALRIHSFVHEDYEFIFVNGFAINDPDSYAIVWDQLRERLPKERCVVPLVVCRRDRVLRSEQLGELIGRRIPADRCIAAGQGTAPFVRGVRRSCPGVSIDNLDGQSAQDVYDYALQVRSTRTVVFYGMGNIVGFGEQIAQRFAARSETHVQRDHEFPDDRVDRSRARAQLAVQ